MACMLNNGMFYLSTTNYSLIQLTNLQLCVTILLVLMNSDWCKSIKMVICKGISFIWIIKFGENLIRSEITHAVIWVRHCWVSAETFMDKFSLLACKFQFNEKLHKCSNSRSFPNGSSYKHIMVVDGERRPNLQMVRPIENTVTLMDRFFGSETMKYLWPFFIKMG